MKFGLIKVLSKNIVLNFSFTVLTCSIAQGQITGFVYDENGQGLPSATIYLDQTSIGVITNEQGEYTIQPPKDGEVQIVAQYVGYKIQKKSYKYKSGIKSILHFTLEPEITEIQEIFISADREDPAYPIIREAIKKREFHRHQIKSLSADLYVKGKIKMLDAPKMFMGQQLGNLGGVLNTNRQGILYLSESLSKYYYLDPNKSKEVMVSTIKSGENNVFTANRFDIFKFDVYDEYYFFTRSIPSPLSDRATTHYKFMLESSTYGENGEKIYKIKIIPSSSSEPLLDGYIYIADLHFNVTAFDCHVNSGTLRGTIFDSLSFQQLHVPIDGPETRKLLSQVVSFKGSAFGFKVGGVFSYVFSNYEINPDLTKVFSSLETFSVDRDALQQDLNFWNEMRPVPLTEDEKRDYTFKDSLAKVWKSKPFLDSLDKANNAFKPIKIITGFSYQNSFKGYSVGFPSILQALAFNPVEGWNYTLPLKYEFPDSMLRRWEITPTITYGTSDNQWKPSIYVKRIYDNYYQAKFSCYVGRKFVQFDKAIQVIPITNTINNLFLKINKIRLYDQRLASISWGREVKNGLYLQLNTMYEQRKPIENKTNYSLFYKEKEYTPNTPEQLTSDDYNSNTYVICQSILSWKPNQSYSSYPNLKITQESLWPTLVFHISYYRSLTTNFPSFLSPSFMVESNFLPAGLWGYSRYKFNIGTFLWSKPKFLGDFYHPNANSLKIPFISRSLGFNLMDFYKYSTNTSYIEFFGKHHFDGKLFDKIPFLRKTSLKEIMGVGTFFDQSGRSHTELTFGIENFKIGPIKVFDFEYTWVFDKRKYNDQGFVIRLNKLF